MLGLKTFGIYKHNSVINLESKDYSYRKIYTKNLARASWTKKYKINKNVLQQAKISCNYETTISIKSLLSQL